MSARDSIDRLFEAIIERQESTFDNIKGANERVHRFARSVPALPSSVGSQVTVTSSGPREPRTNSSTCSRR